MAAAADGLQHRPAALGLSQRALARAIGKDPGHVSRVLRGIVTSAPVTRRIEAYLAGREQDHRRTEAWLRRQLEGPDGGRA
jgi:transcriptional regulator with XRE-family HTH domain